MSWPYVEKDANGGWYADCEGVMQDSDPNRTQVEAMQWCIDRLASQLGRARHGCTMLRYSHHINCRLHEANLNDGECILEMRRQMRESGTIDVLPDWTTSRIVRRYEVWINELLKKAEASA